jgi:hypothetical protein
VRSFPIVAIVFGLGAAPVAAHADDRARTQAAEANLEPTRLREGFAIGIAIGGGMQVGFGIEEASGTPGAGSLRIGTSASDRLAWFIDLIQAGTPRRGDDGGAELNRTNVLGAGAQIFALPTLWIRGGAGLGHLKLNSESNMGGYYGLGMYGGGGVDFLRRGRFALSGEVEFISGLYKDGLVSAVVFQLGATLW